MADFLLELRSEEIPARMQADARKELEKLFRREMEAAGVTVGDLTVWSTPRRLALIARGLPLETEALREEAKGPPVGAPDKAIEGFCRKNGVTPDQLEEREVKGRATYFAVIEKPGQSVSDLLAAAIPAIIRDFSWPKSMRWGEASISSESTRWVRPLSGIVALLDGEVVPCVTEGLASGRETMGHRFHHRGSIAVTDADSYAAQLREARVIVDHAEREDAISEGARKAAQEAGLVLVEDEGLVIENAGLTEWPVPLLGRFDEDYLDVPPEVIQLTARVNQKYFVCEEAANDGVNRLANAFICTANIEAVDPAVVVDGNRKVLAARLADARFFWELDQKTSLAEHAKGLERITFHEKLGTVADKVERVAKLARWLVEEGIVKPTSVRPEPVEGQANAPANRTSTSSARTVEELADLAEQAARLAKADLVTEMVGEFPELQGLMGGYYAEKEGLPVEVSDAIRDHYKPVGQGDEVPTAPVTVAVSLADKLDTVFCLFSVGLEPTGSKDPFALRRAAIGINSMILQNEIALDIGDALQNTGINYQSLYKSSSEFRAESDKMVEGFHNRFPDRPRHPDKFVNMAIVLNTILMAKLFYFFTSRLIARLRSEGKRHDLIEAVLVGRPHDLLGIIRRANALQSFVETEDGENLLSGYKRAANILKKEGFDTPLPEGEGSGVGGATSQPSNTHPQPVGASRPLRVPSRDGPIDDNGVAATGEEDPLALVGKPEFDAAMRSTQNPSGKDLSYTLEKAEKALIDALADAEPQAARAIEEEDFEAAMAALASLRAPIDAFFDEVTVNDDNPDKRAARLALLARFRDAVHRVADFSRIEG